MFCHGLLTLQTQNLTRIDNDMQGPVYYVHNSLHEAKVHYLPLEKAILAVVHTTRKLPHYF